MRGPGDVPPVEAPEDYDNYGRCYECGEQGPCLDTCPTYLRNVARLACPVCMRVPDPPIVCVDGQEVCSEACRSTYEAGA